MTTRPFTRLIATIAGATLIASILAAAPGAAQERPRGAPQTDQTVDARHGSRFSLESLNGDVTVRGWDKDAVRVRAWHASRVRLAVRTSRSSVVTVEDNSDHGPQPVEYEIDLPRWMPVTIEVTYDNISVEGVQSDVSAESVRGSITIKGAAGSVHAETVQGKIIVEGARARVEASTVNDEIRLSDITGEVAAETTIGAITLARIASPSVEATAVNGAVTYEGSVADDGHYACTTHNGDITVMVPEHANITLEVRTYDGTFKPDLAVTGTRPSRKGARAVYTLGNGAAQMEVETFGGTIRLQGSAGAKEEQ